MSQRRTAATTQSLTLVLVALMLAVVCVGFASTVEAQSNLPPCQGSYSISTWNYCQGTMTFLDGEKYVGEFKDGMRNGQGTLTLPTGEKYVGEYKDGMRNGQGAYTSPNGQKYVGEFKDNKYNGIGKLFASDGTVAQQGYWIADKYFGPTTPPPGYRASNSGSPSAQERLEREAQQRLEREAQQRLEREAQQIQSCRMIDECAEYGKFQKECATAGDIDKCVLLKMSPKLVPNYCTRDGTGQVAFMGPTSIVTKLDCKIALAKEMGEKLLNKLK